MREWVVHLQHFFISGARNQEALRLAVESCGDPEIRALLPHLPPSDQETSVWANQLLSDLQKRGLNAAEVTVFTLVLLLPNLAGAEDARALPPEERFRHAEFLDFLTETCRKSETLKPSLALISSVRGTLHRSVGDFAAARKAYEEALDIKRKLAKADPHTHQDGLASTLNSLGNIYKDIRDFTAAREILEEARDVYATLARADPRTYRYNLAATLNNLGDLYRNTRDFAAARGALEEARSIAHKLADGDPHTDQNELGITLSNLGIFYLDTRDFVAARKILEEARDVYATLAKADPHTYQYDLAKTLNNLGTLYGDTRDFAAAREAYEEALAIKRKLAEADSQAHQHDLAKTLVNLGGIYNSMKDFAAARELLEEARDVYATLARANPQTYQYNLVATLNNLGTLYGNTRDFAAARGALEEARSIAGKLARADPQTYQYDLAKTLNNLGTLYHDTSDFAAAREAYEESVSQAEAVISDHQRYLSKGQAAAAYHFLLGEVIDDTTAAFAYAAAMRDGQIRSSAICEHDLRATQSLVQNIERRIRRNTAILVPSWGHGDKILLGLITAWNCGWWRMSSKAWTDLISKESRTADHRARHQLARRIWCELPLGIQESLAPTSPTGFEILISGDPLWAAFPWELLRFGEGADDYLGLHRALPRIGSILAPVLERTLAATSLGKNRRVAIVAPHTTGSTPLLGVEIEVEALESRIPKIGGGFVERKTTGSAAHEGLMRRAIDAAPGVLWYSGHGAIIANEEVLVLHAEMPRGNWPEDKVSYFGAYQLGEIANEKGLEALFDHAPLVVLNSCMTGRTREHGGQREDMVESFLKHGAGAVIATSMPIFDSVGEALGRAMFSDAAIARQTIGDLVVEVRRQLATSVCGDINQPTWGAWGMVHLHGNSLAAGPFHEPGRNKDE